MNECSRVHDEFRMCYCSPLNVAAQLNCEGTRDTFQKSTERELVSNVGFNVAQTPTHHA
jgi:hypothetical protein